MTKKVYPVFHKGLMEQSAYPSAKRRIKFEVTSSSYIYKTGDHFYKIHKERPSSISLALTEIHVQEALVIGKRWAPEIILEVAPILGNGGSYSFLPPGEVAEYALKCLQLSDHYWLHKLIPQGKLTPIAVGRLARYLADLHAAHPADAAAADACRPEPLQALAEEVFYQVKKYLDVTLTEPLLDLVTRPVFKFIEESRKLLQRRIKKQHIVECHGAFVPEHIYIKSKDIYAVSSLAAPNKFRVLDAANDLATLCNELILAEAEESCKLFIKRYITASKDRDVEKVLPFYQTVQAMRKGLIKSEMLSESGITEEARGELFTSAHNYFNLAVRTAKEIPR